MEEWVNRNWLSWESAYDVLKIDAKLLVLVERDPLPAEVVQFARWAKGHNSIQTIQSPHILFTIWVPSYM